MNHTVVGNVQGTKCAGWVLQQAALVDQFHLALLSREVFTVRRKEKERQKARNEKTNRPEPTKQGNGKN